MRSITRWALLIVASFAFAGCAEELTPLTKSSAEPAGEHCAEGGTRIAMGVDSDGDGILSEDEITSTSYICDKASEPPESMKPLILISETPPTEDCLLGGQRVDIGLDTNGDGVLDPSEIESSEQTCHGDVLKRVHFGDLSVRSDADLEELSQYTMILGDVYIGVPGTFASGSIEARGPRHITGELYIDDCGGGSGGGINQFSVSLPDLELVGEDLAVYSGCGNAEIVEVSLPRLRRTGYLYLYRTRLESFAAPSLEETWGVEFERNPELSSVSLPSLSVLNELYVSRNPKLESLDIGDAKPDLWIGFYENEALSNCVPFSLSTKLLSKVGSWDVDVFGNYGVACEDAEALCPSLGGLGLDPDYRACVFTRNEMRFDDAREICQELGDDYDLVSFTSAEDFASFAAAEIDFFDDMNFWIGYRSPLHFSSWHWLDGNDFTPADDGSFWDEDDSANGESVDYCGRFVRSNAQVSTTSCEGFSGRPLCRAQ